MGDKGRARELMAAAGVPVVPGYDGDDAGRRDACGARRERIGFPVMIKASRGGGGKGMRIVGRGRRVRGRARGPRREARAAFGDGRMLLERYVERPRHVEVQVLADAHGAMRAPRRARVLDPAPAPEDHRGDALARR